MADKLFFLIEPTMLSPFYSVCGREIGLVTRLGPEDGKEAVRVTEALNRVSESWAQAREKEAVEAFREKLLQHWNKTEERSAEAHAVYQKEAHRRGDVRHPDAYEDLSDTTKEWDRVLVRWVAESIRSLPAGTEGKAAGS